MLRISLVVALGILAGCVTKSTVAPVIVGQKDFDQLEVQDKSPSTLFKKKDSPKPGEQPLFTEAEATKTFKLLCHGGKPKRKVEHKVTFVLPKIPAGMPLDQAQKLTVKYQTMMRAEVANFYRLLAFGHYQERLQNFNINPGHDQFTVPGYPYLLLPTDDQRKGKSLIEDLESEGVLGNALPTLGLAGMDPVGGVLADDRPKVYPLLVQNDEKRRPYVMSFAGPKFYGERFAKVTTSDSRDLEKGMTPAGFTEVVPFELLAIREHYVIAISRAESEAWDKIAAKRRNGLLDAQLSQDRAIGGVVLPHSKLLNSKDQIFTDFLIANTKIVESATEDGQVFEYQVSLNTEPLCRAGRPSSALLSH